MLANLAASRNLREETVIEDLQQGQWRIGAMALVPVPAVLRPQACYGA